MTRTFEGWSWILLCGICASIGCGPVIPRSEEKKDAVATEASSSSARASERWEVPGQSLDLRVIAGTNGSAQGSSDELRRPEPNLNLQRGTVLENPLRTNPTQIFLTRVIPVNDTPLFLVWTDQTLGIPILNSTASHQVLKGHNQLLGQQGPLSVWHDTVQNFWFIRVRDLFLDEIQNNNGAISEADTQILTLQFVLSNNMTTSIEVQFRASGSIR